MLFREVIGQEQVKAKILSMVRGERVPHALTLHGPPGAGKRGLAVAMAQYLSCTGRTAEDSCGRCPSCIKFGKGVHPDLHFVVPVLRTQKVAKDPVTDDYIGQWREAFLENPYLPENQWYETIEAENRQGLINTRETEELIKKLNFKPYESEYRMVVVWLPEKMNAPAANKLLKQLEEPPPRTLILMVSEHTDRILPTILSRTQLVHVPPLTDDLVREGLLKTGTADSEVVDDAVRRANGNFGLALSILVREGHESAYFDGFTRLMRMAYARKVPEIYQWVEEMAGIGRERQKQLLEYSLRLLRENFILHMKEPSISFLSGRESEFSARFSPFIHMSNIRGLVEDFTLAANHIEANGNPRIIFMDLAIRVIRHLRVETPVS